MKNSKKILSVVAVAATLGLVNAALADDNNGLIRPSQVWLVHHTWWVKGTPAAPVTPVGYAKYASYYAVASPKEYQRIDEERAQMRAQENAPEVASSRTVGYRAVGDDGIAASPKVRQMLDEQARGSVQIAPVK